MFLKYLQMNQDKSTWIYFLFFLFSFSFCVYCKRGSLALYIYFLHCYDYSVCSVWSPERHRGCCRWGSERRISEFQTCVFRTRVILKSCPEDENWWCVPREKSPQTATSCQWRQWQEVKQSRVSLPFRRCADLVSFRVDYLSFIPNTALAGVQVDLSHLKCWFQDKSVDLKMVKCVQKHSYWSLSAWWDYLKRNKQNMWRSVDARRSSPAEV